MTRQSLSLLHLKLFAVLVLGVCVPLFVIGTMTLESMKNTLSQGFLEKANILESRIVEDLKLAAEVGIPLNKPAVKADLKTYLNHLLASHDEVKFVMLKDGKDKFRIYAGNITAEDVAHVDFSMLKEDMVKNVDDILIMTRNLSYNGVVFAQLYLGVELSYSRDVLMNAGKGVLFAGVVVLIWLWHMAALMAERLYFEPNWLLARQKEEMVAGNPNFIVDGPAGGEFGYAIRLQNSLFKKMRETYKQILQDFVEVREAVFDPSVASSLNEEREKFEKTYGFLEHMGETSDKGRRPSVQRLLFLSLGGLIGSLITLVWHDNGVEELMFALISCVVLLFYLRVFEAHKQRMLATKGTVWSLCVFINGLVMALLLAEFAMIELSYCFMVVTSLIVLGHVLISYITGKES